MKKTTPRLMIIKWLKTSDKEKITKEAKEKDNCMQRNKVKNYYRVNVRNHASQKMMERYL